MVKHARIFVLFTVALLVAVHALVAYGIVVRAGFGTVRAVDPGLREAAANLGATPGFARRALERPALLRAMLAAALQMRSAYLSRLRAISMRWISSVPPPMRVWRSSR